MLDKDRRNEEVIHPYLIGRDLNQQVGGSPSRFIIDFRDWDRERAEGYEQPFRRVEQLVRPERERNRYSESARKRWWLFERARAELYRAIASFERCIVIAQVSNVVQPMFSRTDIVFDQKLVVFAYDDDEHFGVLSSAFHWWWAVTRSSTMRTDVSYTPTDCFETFPQPELTEVVAILGSQLSDYRSGLMLDRQEGLTKTYNRVHDADEHSDDIERLRELHVRLDHAVRDAYGWDLDLGHGFHETRFGTRFTFAPGPRQEVLDRLLELDHERYADEVRQGLHGKPKAKGKRKATYTGAMTLGLDDV